MSTSDRWWDFAECAKPGIDPDIFMPKFAPRTEALSERATFAKAAKVCARCPVQTKCREDILKMQFIEGGDFMYAGGLYPSQLARLRVPNGDTQDDA